MKQIATVHEGINPFKCSVCDVKFANKQFEEAYKICKSQIEHNVASFFHEPLFPSCIVVNFQF